MQSRMKWLKLSTGILAGSLLLAACGDSETTDDSASGETTDTSSEETTSSGPVEITFWHAMNGLTKKQLRN